MIICFPEQDLMIAVRVCSGLVAGFDFVKKPIEVIDEFCEKRKGAFYKKSQILHSRGVTAAAKPAGFRGLSRFYGFVRLFVGCDLGHDTCPVRIELVFYCVYSYCKDKQVSIMGQLHFFLYITDFSLVRDVVLSERKV